MARWFVLITLVPVVELALLVWIGSKTSWWAVVALVLATGVGGAWLLRQQGWQAAARVRADMAAGRVPADSLFDGLLVIVAGVLLIVPGVLTDIAAILLLLPPARELAKRWLRGRLRLQSATAYSQTYTTIDARSAPSHDEIIDVRVIESKPR